MTDRDLLLWGGPYFDFPLEPSAFQPLIDQHSGNDPLRECWAVENSNGQLIGSFDIQFIGSSLEFMILTKPRWQPIYEQVSSWKGPAEKA